MKSSFGTECGDRPVIEVNGMWQSNILLAEGNCVATAGVVFCPEDVNWTDNQDIPNLQGYIAEMYDPENIVYPTGQGIGEKLADNITPELTTGGLLARSDTGVVTSWFPSQPVTPSPPPAPPAAPPVIVPQVITYLSAGGSGDMSKGAMGSMGGGTLGGILLSLFFLKLGGKR